MPATTKDSGIQLIIRILRDAGEPTTNRHFDAEVKRIMGDGYKQSQHIRISNLRTALRSVGVVSHPRRGLWGLMPDADERDRRIGGG